MIISKYQRSKQYLETLGLLFPHEEVALILKQKGFPVIEDDNDVETINAITFEHIKIAYKASALVFHPDKYKKQNLTEQEATQKFQEIDNAFKYFVSNSSILTSASSGNTDPLPTVIPPTFIPVINELKLPARLSVTDYSFGVPNHKGYFILLTNFHFPRKIIVEINCHQSTQFKPAIIYNALINALLELNFPEVNIRNDDSPSLLSSSTYLITSDNAPINSLMLSDNQLEKFIEYFQLAWLDEARLIPLDAPGYSVNRIHQICASMIMIKTPVNPLMIENPQPSPNLDCFNDHMALPETHIIVSDEDHIKKLAEVTNESIEKIEIQIEHLQKLKPNLSIKEIINLSQNNPGILKLAEYLAMQSFKYEQLHGKALSWMNGLSYDINKIKSVAGNLLNHWSENTPLLAASENYLTSKDFLEISKIYLENKSSNLDSSIVPAPR